MAHIKASLLCLLHIQRVGQAQLDLKAGPLALSESVLLSLNLKTSYPQSWQWGLLRALFVDCIHWRKHTNLSPAESVSWRCLATWGSTAHNEGSAMTDLSLKSTGVPHARLESVQANCWMGHTARPACPGPPQTQAGHAQLFPEHTALC